MIILPLVAFVSKSITKAGQSVNVVFSGAQSWKRCSLGQIWVRVKNTLYRQVSTSDAYVIDTLWSVRDDNVYSGVWSFWGRWQRIIHVVIFNADDNLEYKLSSFYRWELINRVLIFSTDDDNLKNTLSPVKRWHPLKCVVIGVPMTTWLLSCYLHRWQP